MASYLLFTLRGPMQSWGGASSVGEKRLSAQHPSHSAVVGLLAAALGIRREHSEALDALHGSLRVAVCQNKVGGIMTDYHTVQSAKNMNKRFFYTRREEVKTKIDKFESLETTLSSRIYLTDAVFTVCVWQAEEGGEHTFTLEDVCQALMKPRLTLYLGRKSCPISRPLIPMLEDASHIAEAFQRYSKRYSEIMHEPLSTSTKDMWPVWPIWPIWPIWTDAGHGMDMDTNIVCQVKDRVLCSARRQYGMRNEYYSTLSPKDLVPDAIESALDDVFHKGDKHYVHE